MAGPPQYTRQQCSECGAAVMKALSERTHRCPRCGTVLDGDQNGTRPFGTAPITSGVLAEHP